MVIAELDADKYRDLAQEYDVHGFPTLKIFVNGEPKPYSGDRSLDDLVEFVNNAAGTARKSDGRLPFQGQGGVPRDPSWGTPRPASASGLSGRSSPTRLSTNCTPGRPAAPPAGRSPQ